jgi:hypothetical protein
VVLPPAPRQAVANPSQHPLAEQRASLIGVKTQNYVSLIKPQWRNATAKFTLNNATHDRRNHSAMTVDLKIVVVITRQPMKWLRVNILIVNFRGFSRGSDGLG